MMIRVDVKHVNMDIIQTQKQMDFVFPVEMDPIQVRLVQQCVLNVTLDMEGMNKEMGVQNVNQVIILQVKEWDVWNAQQDLSQ